MVSGVQTEQAADENSVVEAWTPKGVIVGAASGDAMVDMARWPG